MDHSDLLSCDFQTSQIRRAALSAITATIATHSNIQCASSSKKCTVHILKLCQMAHFLPPQLTSYTRSNLPALPTLANKQIAVPFDHQTQTHRRRPRALQPIKSSRIGRQTTECAIFSADSRRAGAVALMISSIDLESASKRDHFQRLSRRFASDSWLAGLCGVCSGL